VVETAFKFKYKHEFLSLNIFDHFIDLIFRAIDFYVKKYEKSRKHEIIEVSAFVKKSYQMRHAFGMVNNFLTNTMFINIEYLCIAIF
jgi:hypothetical protein